MNGFGKKMKAGALQFAILISVVIALLLAGFILLTYTHQRLTKHIDIAGETITLCHSGIDYAQQVDIPYNEQLQVEIEGMADGVLEIIKTHWGIYDKLISRAQRKTNTYQKIALLGGRLSQEERPALHLEDTNTPLVLVGNTDIQGDALLPRQGVKAGNIAGNYYQGAQLIYGTVSQTGKELPMIKREKKAYIKQLLSGAVPQEDSLFVQDTGSDRLSHSFSRNPKWMYRRGVVHLNHQDIQNNIIIRSDTLVRVSAFAKAENVILIAPYIRIESGFSGSLQAFASKQLFVEKNVTLHYPSALVVLQEETGASVSEQKNETASIIMDEGSRIAGSVLYLEKLEERVIRPKVRIAPNTVIHGELYSRENMDLSGTVEGSVFTHQFATQQRGSVYQNHIYNSTIDVRKLPETFCGIATEITQNHIVAWVD